MALADYVKQFSNEPLPEIEIQRRLLKQRMGEQSQAERQALERRFASMGGGPSGAQVKAMGQLGEQQARREEEAQMGLTAQEIQARMTLEEAEKQRKFMTGEREAGQTFAKTMQEQERGAQQAFARQEREAQQVFQKGMAEQDLAFRERVFKAEDTARIKQMEIQQEQFKQQMQMEKEAMEFNKQVAQWQMSQPTDLMGSLFGPAFSMNPSTGTGPIGATMGAFQSVTSALTKPFCFLEGTKICLADGSEINIENIKIDDKCAFGGKVKEIGKSFSTDLYNYKGVYVTGSHAVQEEGKWIRVADSKHSIKEHQANEGGVVIYWVSNEYHRLFINGIMFLDFEELDNSEEMSDEQILNILNGVE